METLNTQIGMILWIVFSLAMIVVWGRTVVQERSSK